jgi:serine protease Do
VALLQLTQMPKGIAPATLGDSDKVEVGDQIFVIGAPFGISQTLSAGHLSGRHRLNSTQNAPGVEFFRPTLQLTLVTRVARCLTWKGRSSA